VVDDVGSRWPNDLGGDSPHTGRPGSVRAVTAGSALSSLLGRVGAGLFQQAYVVDDFDGSQRALRETLGCSSFVTLPPSDLDYDFRGGRTTCALDIGFARSGNVQIELIRPVRGTGLHSEFLAVSGPGAHHLGFLVDDLDAEVHEAEELGFANVQGATFGALRFCYLDTFDAFGLYVELVEDPTGMMMALMPWR
jgi:glyoxalase/bleomycin resistance protein/dioxygenase superfamily protein